MSWFVSISMVLTSFYWVEKAIIGFLVQIHARFFYHHYDNQIIGLHTTSHLHIFFLNNE
jgi:hypothetical protein